jgi:hypothetical protein
MTYYVSHPMENFLIVHTYIFIFFCWPVPFNLESAELKCTHTFLCASATNCNVGQCFFF